QPRNPSLNGYYPCNVCSYGYQQPRPNKYNTSHRSQNFRTRSHSGPPQRNSSPVPSQAECTHLYSNYHKRSPYDDHTNDIVHIGRRSFDLRGPRFDVLTFDQVRCLNSVLEQRIQIRPGTNFNTSAISLMNLIKAVKNRLLQKEITLYDV